MPYTDTVVNNLVINVLDKDTYNGLTPNMDELYLITDDASSALNIAEGSGISIDLDSEGTSIITNTAPIWHDDIESSEGDDYAISILKIIYPVGSVYMNVNNINPSTFIPNTTWELISSVGLASENVFGNGYNMAITDNTGNSALTITSATVSGTTIKSLSYRHTSYGVEVPLANGTSGSGTFNSGGGIGIPTKEQHNGHPEYSGIIADTITLYTWKRTA